MSALINLGLVFSMTPMPRARYDHSCGLVAHPQLGPEVVVAGGYSLGYSDTVDIYTVNTDSWRQGKLNMITTRQN